MVECKRLAITLSKSVKLFSNLFHVALSDLFADCDELIMIRKDTFSDFNKHSNSSDVLLIYSTNNITPRILAYIGNPACLNRQKSLVLL